MIDYLKSTISDRRSSGMWLSAQW